MQKQVAQVGQVREQVILGARAERGLSVVGMGWEGKGQEGVISTRGSGTVSVCPAHYKA